MKNYIRYQRKLIDFNLNNKTKEYLLGWRKLKALTVFRSSTQINKKNNEIKGNGTAKHQSQELE